MHRIVLGLIVALSLLFAGCIGGSDDAAEDGELLERAEVTEDTGGIQGAVTNAAIEAVPDITVTLEQTGETTESSMDGSFAFSELSPGAYTLVFEGDGFLPTQKEVDVSAGEVTFVDIVLTEEPTREPYSVQNEMTGFIECSARAGPAPDPEPTGFFLGVAVCSVPNSLVPGNATNDRFNFFYEIEPDPWQKVTELQWDPSQQLAEEFSVRVEPEGIANDRATEFGAAWDSSPMHIHTDRDRFIEVDENTTEICEEEEDSVDPDDTYCDRYYVEEGGVGQIRVFVSHADPIPAGLAIQEDYQLVISTFYHAPACEEYSVFQGNTCDQEVEPRHDEHSPGEDDQVR